MDEYLKTLQSINQSIEQALQNTQNSTEEKQFASHLSNSVQVCVDEIFASTNKLKNIVESSLEDLDKAENILQNYFKISREVSPLTPLEEIGKLSGQNSKILRLIEESKQEVFEQLKASWQQDFEDNIKQWFTDKEGKIKKGIGWNEKSSFIKEVKIIKLMQLNQLQQLLKQEYKLILGQISLMIDLNIINIKNSWQIIDYEAKINYQKTIYIVRKKIQTYFVFLDNCYNEDMKNFILKSNLVLSPIINSKWGDLPWDLVIKIKLEYINEIEKSIYDIFLEKAELTTSLFEVIIKIYNDFLQKQAFYNQQSPEEQQAKQEWINTQREKLQTLHNSLENISNFQL